MYAEDPAKQYRPSPGTVTEIEFGAEARVDGWVERGTEITPYYDPLIAKVIVRGDTRDQAIALTRAVASKATRIAGVETNLAYLRQIIASVAFLSGDVSTRLLANLEYTSTSIDVVEGGTQTTVQDLPGRVGAWAVGVPPSGPMDDLAFAVANRIVGNEDGAAGLEMTLSGPTLRFRSAAILALTGARMKATIDGAAVPLSKRGSCARRKRTAPGGDPRPRVSRLSRGARRHRRAGVSRLAIDVHARSIRRPRRPRAAGGRRAARWALSSSQRGHRLLVSHRARHAAGLPGRVGNRRARWSALRARFLHAG